MSTAPPDPLQTAIKMLLRTIDSQDWGVVEALLHAQTEYEVSGFLPFRGRDAVMNYYKVLRPIRKGEHLIESSIIDGNRAVVWGRFAGTRKDGLDFSLLFADVMTFEDKKIRKRRVYYCEPKA